MLLRIIFYATIVILTPGLIIAQTSQTRSVIGNKPGGYEIIGHMEGLKDGEKVYMQFISGRSLDEYLITDSAYVKDNNFHISGFVDEGPRQYILNFDKHPSKNVYLLINNRDHIIIHSKNIESIHHDFLHNYISIEGSKSTRTYHEFWEMLPLYSQSIGRINNYLREMKDSIGFDPSLVGASIEAKSQVNQALYYNYLNNLDSGYLSNEAIPFLVFAVGYLGHSSLVTEIYNSVNDRARNSFYGKILKENAMLSIGQPFPGFSLTTSEGQILKLDDVVKKSKVTLVHFWASNSIDRLKYQEELRFLYKKYHDKGFNIVGVSSDDSTSEYTYRKMLRDHPFPWPNVSDLKGKEGIVEKVYHEYGDDKIHNTTNILIDDKGRIIAWDPIGSELQWYLFKNLGE